MFKNELFLKLAKSAYLKVYKTNYNRFSLSISELNLHDSQGGVKKLLGFIRTNMLNYILLTGKGK